MIRQLALFLAALFSLAPALAQSPAAAPPPADVRVALDTGAGRILIAVHVAQAPATAANFLRYVDQKRLDGASFYRGVGSADYGFVQGGAQNDPKRILPPVKHEPTSQTGLTHDDGALSMARYAPGSATGDFFIVLGKMPGMDAHPAGPIIFKAFEGGDGERLDAFGILRPPRHMDLARRNARGRAAVEIAFEETDGLLARRVIAEGVVDLAVDEAGADGAAHRVDHQISSLDLGRRGGADP